MKVNGGYWFSDSGFAAASIDAKQFTHLFCAFADLNPATNEVTVPPAKQDSFSQFTQTVKIRNPSVITLLTIGGPRSSSTFSSMASQSISRTSFIKSAITLARSYGFSGLDLNWTYPQTSSDMVNLGALLSEWRTAIDADARMGMPKLLLTAAVYFSPTVNSVYFPADSLNSNTDWVSVMAFDLHSPSNQSDKSTNSHSMLYDPETKVCGSDGIGAWMEAGVSANKLVLGLPFYGYAWRLVNGNNHGLLAPATGPASTGDGYMGYNKITEFISKNNVPVDSIRYDERIVTNYCYSGTTWIGYDGIQSISKKVWFAKHNNLLGYFVWHVGIDDKWALSKAAKESSEA